LKKMKLTEEVYIVGSGRNGLGISNEYDCHVYLINGGGELALIDAGVGMDVQQIMDNVTAEGFRIDDISRVLLTHAHADHSGGCAALKSELGLSLIVSSEEADLLQRADEEQLGLAFARSAGWYPPEYRLRPCQVDIELEDGQRITVGDLRIRAIRTPGHSRGSVCYLMEGEEATYLFTGDTVFLRGLISLLNAPGSSVQDYCQSIRKLADLGVDALLPGHLGFCLRGGQKHIDQAIEAFADLPVPKCVF
jgi:hydroxyacylglutathione hydrolase